MKIYYKKNTLMIIRKLSNINLILMHSINNFKIKLTNWLLNIKKVKKNLFKKSNSPTRIFKR